MSRTEESLGFTPALDGARKVHHDCAKAIKGLKAAAEAPQEPSLTKWATDAIAALFKVRESLGEHIEVTEAPGGLFEEILERAPRLTHEVHAVREGCKTLDAKIADVLVTLTDPGADGVHLSERMNELHHAIEAQRKREADLVFEAYEVDIGAED